MKFGLIGIGKQGTELFNIFQQLIPNSINCCYDPFVSNQLGIKQTEDIPSLLDNVDAVIIASPHKEHAPQTIMAINANKHVFVEKPIALSSIEIYNIEKALNTHNVVVRQNLKYRYLYEKPPAIGRPYYVQSSYTRRRGVPLTPFFTVKRFAQLGVLADLGGHLVDIAFYLSGWPNIIETTTRSLIMSHNLPSPIGIDLDLIDWNEKLDKEIHKNIDVEDRCFINVNCHNCLMSFDIGWVSHQKENDEFFLKIVGDEGTMYAHKMEIIFANGNTSTINHCDEAQLNKISIQDFLAEINGEPIKIAQSISQWKTVTNVICS